MHVHVITNSWSSSVLTCVTWVNKWHLTLFFWEEKCSRGLLQRHVPLYHSGSLSHLPATYSCVWLFSSVHVHAPSISPFLCQHLSNDPALKINPPKYFSFFKFVKTPRNNRQFHRCLIRPNHLAAKCNSKYLTRHSYIPQNAMNLTISPSLRVLFFCTKTIPEVAQKLLCTSA